MASRSPPPRRKRAASVRRWNGCRKKRGQSQSNSRHPAHSKPLAAAYLAKGSYGIWKDHTEKRCEKRLPSIRAISFYYLSFIYLSSFFFFPLICLSPLLLFPAYLSFASPSFPLIYLSSSLLLLPVFFPIIPSQSHSLSPFPTPASALWPTATGTLPRLWNGYPL